MYTAAEHLELQRIHSLPRLRTLIVAIKVREIRLQGRKRRGLMELLPGHPLLVKSRLRKERNAAPQKACVPPTMVFIRPLRNNSVGGYIF